MRTKITLTALGLILLLTIPALSCECDPECEGCAVCENGVCVAGDCDNPCEYCVMESGTWGDCKCYEDCCGDSDCPDCHGCIFCWCFCSSQCCIDSQCGHPDCWNCVNCHCELQCNEGQICCDDGSCAKPCELEQNTVMCTGETVPCPHDCCVFCEDQYKTNWTGNTINSCKEPGCPGDCQDDVKPVCYTKTMCNQKVIVKMMCLFCTCYVAPTQGFACTICEHGKYEVVDHYAPYNKKCGQ